MQKQQTGSVGEGSVRAENLSGILGTCMVEEKKQFSSSSLTATGVQGVMDTQNTINKCKKKKVKGTTRIEISGFISKGNKVSIS